MVRILAAIGIVLWVLAAGAVLLGPLVLGMLAIWTSSDSLSGHFALSAICLAFSLGWAALVLAAVDSL